MCPDSLAHKDHRVDMLVGSKKNFFKWNTFLWLHKQNISVINPHGPDRCYTEEMSLKLFFQQMFLTISFMFLLT